MWAMHTPYKLQLHLDSAWLQHLELHISSKRTPQQKCLATGLTIYVYAQNISDWAISYVAIQWNLCIMDTLGPAMQKCPDCQGVLIFQVSLHDNVSFGTRCVDYAGVHIFKCPD